MKKSAHNIEVVLNLIRLLRELMHIRIGREEIVEIRLEEALEVGRMIEEGCPNCEPDPW